MLSRLHIQLRATALAGGAAAGLYAPNGWQLAILAAALVVGLRRPGLLLLTVLLASGLLRGWMVENVQADSSRPVTIAPLQRSRDWLERSMRQALPQSEATLLAGILLGSRHDLPPDIRHDFRRTGTSHIMAVSGYNVTIVVAMMVAFFRAVPLGRGGRTLGCLTAITVFVLLTGASASVVRAGTMGALVVLARAFGRLSSGLHLLVVTAAIMIFVQPEIVTDIGFQLSVAATAGLLLWSDPIEQKLQFLPAMFGLRSSLASTLAAIMATQPLLSIHFGQLSAVAPLVNMLVLPLIPLSMAVGFAASLISGLWPALSLFVSWVAWLPLHIVLQIVHTAALLPFASIQSSPEWSVIVAGIFALIAMIIQRGTRHV